MDESRDDDDDEPVNGSGWATLDLCPSLLLIVEEMNAFRQGHVNSGQTCHYPIAVGLTMSQFDRYPLSAACLFSHADVRLCAASSASSLYAFLPQQHEPVASAL